MEGKRRKKKRKGIDTPHKQRLVWVYCPGYPGVRSVRRQASDILASRMPVVETLTMDIAGIRKTICERLPVEHTMANQTPCLGMIEFGRKLCFQH